MFDNGKDTTTHRRKKDTNETKQYTIKFKDK